MDTLYENILRPILFTQDPETMHELALKAMSIVGAVPPLRAAMEYFSLIKTPKPIKLFGLKFPNRVGLAAGFDKDAYAWRGAAALGFGQNNAQRLAYAFASAPHSTLLMHASVVRNDGTGYLFLGKSGTGKSTHTRLWLKYIPGSDLMNDDNPVVRVENGIAYVYGSPWSGKTPCYRNVVAPVGGFVQLQQCPENAIRRENVLGSFASLLPSISTMKWDKRIYTAHCDTISELIRTTPLYHLGCLPDEAAARLSYHTLTGK